MKIFLFSDVHMQTEGDCLFWFDAHDRYQPLRLAERNYRGNQT